MLPTRYLKRTWFWLGMGTGALALAGLITWLWRTRPHGPNIQPVQIDFTFLRHPAEAARGAAKPPAAPQALQPDSVAAPAVETASETVPAPAVETASETAPDDLTVLIGVGPRIAGVLREAGVSTFAQLAQADPAWLREVLQAHNLRLADPESWPEQARLAAQGQVDAIKQFSARRGKKGL